MTESDIVTIEILGTRLQLRGGEDPEAVIQAGEYVRQHVHELAERAPTAPSVQLVLLAAINIADQLNKNSGYDELFDEAEQRILRMIGKMQSAMQ